MSLKKRKKGITRKKKKERNKRIKPWEPLGSQTHMDGALQPIAKWKTGLKSCEFQIPALTANSFFKQHAGCSGAIWDSSFTPCIIMLVQVPSAVICSLLHGLNFFCLTETRSEILVTLSYLQIYWREVKNSSVSKDLNWLQKRILYLSAHSRGHRWLY